MVFPSRNQLPRSPQQRPFRNGPPDLRGIPREIRNTNGAAEAKGGSRGLSRLLSGGAAQSLAQTGGVSTLSKTLGGVQQVLGVVQSTAPLIQEYGPMVKNLPSMYRMMKAFKSFNSEDNEATTETLPPQPSKPKQEIHHQQQQKKPEQKKEAPVPAPAKEKGISTPKMYI
ncbi:VrrA/YqfQ family protein [Oceanobacillus locisalsi]|uniref:VrrA/YqfQ family protein n=1 Tax=Oceanobacillus locisalsi TaxID=546107 RepID=A0ABW3NL07_9BACI